ncbi:hypothetical protein D0T56_14440 [Dysgonomonas sp. 520]|nr:hypothetical protein [Dysgonomonas sp. 520]
MFHYVQHDKNSKIKYNLKSLDDFLVNKARDTSFLVAWDLQSFVVGSVSKVLNFRKQPHPLKGSTDFLVAWDLQSHAWLLPEF